MNVRDIRPDNGLGGAAPIQPVRAINPHESAHAPIEREDLVEISDEARALAARDDAAVEGTLGADRILALRRWVQAGGYDAPEVIDQVARRLLESGDV